MAVTAFGKFSADTTEQKRDQIETVMQFQELYKEKCAPDVAASLDFSFWRYREMLAPTTLTQRVAQALDNGYTCVFSHCLRWQWCRVVGDSHLTVFWGRGTQVSHSVPSRKRSLADDARS